jgi:hypothetical protein
VVVVVGTSLPGVGAVASAVVDTALAKMFESSVGARQSLAG